MVARITWLTYAVCALAVVPAAFYIRFRRLPILSSFPPRDTYALVNFLYSVTLVAYTAILILGAEPNTLSTAWGLAVFACGSALQLWAVAAMGPNWRMGHDPNDQTVRFVSHGPFRFLRHPIYAGLVIIAVGQVLLTGLDRRAFLLIIASVLYFAVQGPAESRYWKERLSVQGQPRKQT